MIKKIDIAVQSAALAVAICGAVCIDGSRLAWACCAIWIVNSMVRTFRTNS